MCSNQSHNLNLERSAAPGQRAYRTPLNPSSSDPPQLSLVALLTRTTSTPTITLDNGSRRRALREETIEMLSEAIGMIPEGGFEQGPAQEEAISNGGDFDDCSEEVIGQ